MSTENGHNLSGSADRNRKQMLEKSTLLFGLKSERKVFDIKTSNRKIDRHFLDSNKELAIEITQAAKKENKNKLVNENFKQNVKMNDVWLCNLFSDCFLLA